MCRGLKKLVVPFHAKSGSGLAYPCFSNVLALKHKQLIVFLIFSAKEHVKKYTVNLTNMTSLMEHLHYTALTYVCLLHL